MRALVAYGTRWGSTEEVARELAMVLEANAHSTTVVDLRVRKTVDLEAYDLVVVGSGIAYGSWSKDALRFLDRSAPALRSKKLAMFACCGDLLFDASRVQEYRQRYLVDVAAVRTLEPFTMELFGGVLDFEKYGFLVKGILSMRNAGPKDMAGRGIDPGKPYDFRDWRSIRAWGTSIGRVV